MRFWPKRMVASVHPDSIFSGDPDEQADAAIPDLPDGEDLFGFQVRDKITGFAGIATGRTAYISGCSQILVAPPVGDDGKLPESHWFDEQRIEITGDSIVTLDNSKTPGFDKAAPKR